MECLNQTKTIYGDEKETSRTSWFLFAGLDWITLECRPEESPLMGAIFLPTGPVRRDFTPIINRASSISPPPVDEIIKSVQLHELQ